MVSKTQAALGKLKELELSPFEMICTLLEPMHVEFAPSRNAFFRRDSSVLPRLLSLIYNDTIGQDAFMTCLPADTLRNQFCERISRQMENAKPFFHMSTKDFSLEFLEKYDLCKNVGDYAKGHLDDWMAVLNAATGGLESETKVKETEIVRLPFTIVAGMKLTYPTGTSCDDMPGYEPALIAVRSASVSAWRLCLVDRDFKTNYRSYGCSGAVCLKPNHHEDN